MCRRKREHFYIMRRIRYGCSRRARRDARRDAFLRSKVGKMKLVPPGMTAAEYLQKNRESMNIQPTDRRA